MRLFGLVVAAALVGCVRPVAGAAPAQGQPVPSFPNPYPRMRKPTDLVLAGSAFVKAHRTRGGTARFGPLHRLDAGGAWLSEVRQGLDDPRLFEVRHGGGESYWAVTFRSRNGALVVFSVAQP